MALRSLVRLEAPALSGVWDGEFSRVEVWFNGSFQPLKPKPAAKSIARGVEAAREPIADDGAKAWASMHRIRTCPFVVQICRACNLKLEAIEDHKFTGSSRSCGELSFNQGSHQL